MMRARIYRKAKTAMQSGRIGAGSGTGAGAWVLEYVRGQAARPNAVMGWGSSGEVLQTVSIPFDTCDAAARWAEANGLDYRVEARAKRKLRRAHRTYSDNFSARRRQAWTH